jgi:hypothetical protein
MTGNQEAKNRRTALGEAPTPEHPGRTTAAKLSIRTTDDLRQRSKGLKLPGEDAQIKSQKQVQDCLIMLIYGSNRIESAGASLDVTGCLCRDVFRGETPTLDVEVDDQARKEIVGHAKALLFMIGRVVIENEPWSEELILECHRILYTGLDDHVVAGQYRDHELAVAYGEPGKKQKRSICMRAGAVSGYMKEMVMHLNDDVKWYENAGHIDPYTLRCALSSPLCHDSPLRRRQRTHVSHNPQHSSAEICQSVGALWKHR